MAKKLVERLLALPDLTSQRQFLAAHQAQLDENFCEALKEKVLTLQRVDIPFALRVANLIVDTAKVTGKPLQYALGLRLEAQVMAIELGEYRSAIDLYDAAIKIHRSQNDMLGEAAVQVTRVWPLACLGRYTEAFESGEWASQILKEHSQWRLLATLTMNLAAIYGRLGEDAQALTMLNAAQEVYSILGGEGEKGIALIEQNRGIVLRNLGQFEASIRASQTAREMNTRLGQHIDAAQAQQNLGNTYFVLGRYNEALELLGQARDYFAANGLRRHTILVELFISDCLLQLRRFSDVIAKSQQVRELFSSLEAHCEVAQAVLNEAMAYAGLDRYAEALASLVEARSIFETEENRVWTAITNLEIAIILERQGQLESGLAVAQSCIDVFREHRLPIREAQACLVTAQIAMAKGLSSQALALTNDALVVAESHHIPILLVRSHHLLSRLALANDDFLQSLKESDLAIQNLEHLRGRLMVEFRAGFLEDKHVYYEDAVDLCLKLEQPRQGLEYAERAKSRALLDMLALRLDLSLQPRSAADLPLTDEITKLCAERDRLYRRQECSEVVWERGSSDIEDEACYYPQHLLEIEKRITDLWHSLLIRNADYACDAAVLSQVHTEPVQPHLDADTLLIEYFSIRGALIAFLISNEDVKVCRLAQTNGGVQRQLQFLWHNLKTVPKLSPEKVPGLTQNAQGILRALYDGLLAPLAEACTPGKRLIIVPHGPLHYVPFHALYNGNTYVLEQHEVSYLPGANLLRYCRQASLSDSGMLIMGYSYDNRLPNTLHEAREISALWNSEPRLEAEATLAYLRAEAALCRVLHLATHGSFRADNPLFSGLALADGWLTTLEIFNLRLRASLVCLSACQTGRNMIGGGDELLGLMRAFLHAGAASLVLSQWAVEDCSTAVLMQSFYKHLLAGQTKSAALRSSQLQFLEQDGAYAHPYFWAPFFLVGDVGPL